MSPGTFLFDRKFRFKDGVVGEKIFVLLSSGAYADYLAVKATSKGDRYGIQHGCQILDRFPNFHLVRGSCCLEKSTWVQLDSFYDFRYKDLNDRVMDGSIVQIGALTNELTIQLLSCATYSDDLNALQDDVIKETLRSLRFPSNQLTN